MRYEELVNREIISAQEMERAMVIATQQEKEVETVFSEHLSSIPSVYYLIGMERLKGLKAWTQGRAEGSPIENHPDIPDGI